MKLGRDGIRALAIGLSVLLAAGCGDGAGPAGPPGGPAVPPSPDLSGRWMRADTVRYGYSYSGVTVTYIYTYTGPMAIDFIGGSSYSVSGIWSVVDSTSVTGRTPSVYRYPIIGTSLLTVRGDSLYMQMNGLAVPSFTGSVVTMSWTDLADPACAGYFPGGPGSTGQNCRVAVHWVRTGA